MNKKEKYSLAVGKSDLERMTLLGNIYMPHCTNFLLEHGLQQGLKVADVGCGPGNVSLWLAKQQAIDYINSICGDFQQVKYSEINTVCNEIGLNKLLVVKEHNP